MIKRCCYFLFFVFLSFSVLNAQSKYKVFPGIQNQVKQNQISSAKITSLEFSASINGPFSSNLVLYAGDSLFIKMDVTPLGSVNTVFYIDLNENSVIDSEDMPIGGEIFIDNNFTPPYSIDLNPAEGEIISSIETDTPPSMTVIAEATENSDVVTGIVTFINRPADYTLDGIVSDAGGSPIGGAWVFVDNGSVVIGDATDTLGYYSIPLNGGTYNLEAMHLSGMYSAFDTSIIISGNTTLNITLYQYTSYIRGYVLDESSNPISNVEVWNERGGGTITDDNGMYILMVPPGSGRIGLSDVDLLPNYLAPNSHEYTINENDSIVNTPVSNFVCYTANSTITGQVSENGAPASGQYRILGWCNDLQSYSWAISGSGGNYNLPAHSSMSMPMYGVNIDDWDNNYPWPAGFYPDTSYSNIAPGASGVNFNFIPAETLFTESFTGDMMPPNYSVWQIFQNGNIGGGSSISLEGNRLKVQTVSLSGTSAFGIMSYKPFRINDREYRIYVDNSLLSGNNNSVRIMLTSRRWYGQDPDFFNNSLQLIYERDHLNQRRWRLMRTVNSMEYDIWTSYDSTGHHVLFQFVGSDTLVLKIHGIEDFRGPWGSHFSIAYLYLVEMNSYNELSEPVYFDEIFVGPLGTTAVREIKGSLPTEFSLKQNYPNPFNPVTSIQYDVPSPSHISVDVYNVLGEHIMNLVNQAQAPGKYEVSFFANNLPSGVYYYRMNAINSETGAINANMIRKAILIK